MRDTGDPQTKTLKPLQPQALDLLRMAAQQQFPLSPTETDVLLGHVDWLTEEIERVSEQRDAYRDLAGTGRIRRTVQVTILCTLAVVSSLYLIGAVIF